MVRPTSGLVWTSSPWSRLLILMIQCLIMTWLFTSRPAQKSPFSVGPNAIKNAFITHHILIFTLIPCITLCEGNPHPSQDVRAVPRRDVNCHDTRSSGPWGLLVRIIGPQHLDWSRTIYDIIQLVRAKGPKNHLGPYGALNRLSISLWACVVSIPHLIYIPSLIRTRVIFANMSSLKSSQPDHSHFCCALHRWQSQ